jgi:hypothetical protein
VALEQRCSKGHYYDTAKHSTCPYCGVQGLDVGRTVPKHPPGGESFNQLTDQPRDRGTDDGKTTVVFEQIGIDPPVGWLVCIDGPNRGMDYRIRAGNNSIGRSEGMKICIGGDQGISRDNHAFVLYDPDSNIYMVRPGDSAGLVHHNRKLVTEAVKLSPFDRIKLGKTTLVFVPLCVDFGDDRDVRWL